MSPPASPWSCSGRWPAAAIVTPLQKIHVIEPYVAAVGFVDNPTSMFSRLQTLTIEEYRARRAAHALAAVASTQPAA